MTRADTIDGAVLASFLGAVLFIASLPSCSVFP